MFPSPTPWHPLEYDDVCKESETVKIVHRLAVHHILLAHLALHYTACLHKGRSPSYGNAWLVDMEGIAKQPITRQ